MAELNDIRETVRKRYAAAAIKSAPSDASCCAPIRLTASATDDTKVFGGELYDDTSREGLPDSALDASLGCGVPTAVADLREGETVLDLGSGGGADVLISAARVGPTGKAIGLDMTDEMLALARANAIAAGVENVEFVKGYLEAMPLSDASVDVVISNCVINLSSDKDRVLREAFRVLRPGGRLAVSDVVVRGEVPEAVRQSMLLWVGCIAGALEENDYRAKLIAAGFAAVDLEPTRTYDIEDARTFLTEAGIAVDQIAPQVEGRFLSAFIRATKPAAACCAPGCCSAPARAAQG